MPHFTVQHHLTNLDKCLLDISTRIPHYTMYIVSKYLVTRLSPATLPSNVTQKDAIIIFFYWLCYYPSASSLQNNHRLSHSIYDKIFHQIIHYLGSEEFLNKFIKDERV